MSRIIDLRSDTLTRPTDDMRRAMADAEVGDDVFGEDPTIHKLEETAATLFGKEAALFTASGTMANLVSVLARCGRGDEIILGDQSHIFYYEQGGVAALGGVHPRPIANGNDGTLAPKDIRKAIRPDDQHFPISRLLALENTHNRCYGAPLSLSYMNEIGDLTTELGIGLHLDGARICNAAAALNISLAELAAPAQSLTCCLSKGLSAPVGSVICGSADIIAKARRMRKVVGGGMRQAGVLAAAGILALTRMRDRLAEDHANARRLAEGLAELPGLSVDVEACRTNIVYLESTDPDRPAARISEGLADNGVKALPLDEYRMRMVTHRHISTTDIDDVIRIVAGVMKS